MTTTLHDALAMIRNLYPHPSRLVDAASYADEEGYCVGGAVCKFFDCPGWVRGFPSTRQLASALLVANPALSRQMAHDYATRIIQHNDAGQFDDAWTTAERALTFTA